VRAPGQRARSRGIMAAIAACMQGAACRRPGGRRKSARYHRQRRPASCEACTPCAACMPARTGRGRLACSAEHGTADRPRRSRATSATPRCGEPYGPGARGACRRPPRRARALCAPGRAARPRSARSHAGARFAAAELSGLLREASGARDLALAHQLWGLVQHWNVAPAREDVAVYRAAVARRGGGGGAALEPARPPPRATPVRPLAMCTCAVRSPEGGRAAQIWAASGRPPGRAAARSCHVPWQTRAHARG